MKLQKLRIKNFKSIVDLELDNPSPFSVFVGPNGAGKSNIFEALEFGNYGYFRKTENGNSSEFYLVKHLQNIYGGNESILNRNNISDRIEISVEIKGLEQSRLYFKIDVDPNNSLQSSGHGVFSDRKNDRTFAADVFYKNFSRIFIGNSELTRFKINSTDKLSMDCKNLEKVLRRLIHEEKAEGKITEWLSLFVPNFKKLELSYDPIDGEAKLRIYEEGYQTPFSKQLISDGTRNLIALFTAVFQSKEPQFLCIEEPENGLHPQVIMSLVDFFRQQCEEKGHYIWLNTHSESLVRKLRPEELILVDKREGQTKIKQVRDMNLYDLPTDEAWLTGALGGGLPW